MYFEVSDPRWVLCVQKFLFCYPVFTTYNRNSTVYLNFTYHKPNKYSRGVLATGSPKTVLVRTLTSILSS